MNPKFQLRVQRYGWDKASDFYERLWGAQVEPARRALLEMAALAPGERVLDAACGPGAIAFAAAAAVGPSGFVLGEDISERMVELARARALAEGVGWAKFERRGLEDVGPEATGFDAALCSLGLMYTPDAEAALERLHRTLRPGGRAVAVVWGERRRCGWAEIFPIVDARVQSEVCPLFFLLGGGDALARAFEAAGFAAVETRRLETELVYESAADAVGAAFAGGPVALAYSRFDEATRREAEDEYLASIEPYRRGGGFAIPGEFVAVRGLRQELAAGERGGAAPVDRLP